MRLSCSYGADEAPSFAYDVQDVRTAGCLFDFNFPAFRPRSAIDDGGPICQEAMGDYYPVALWCDKATFLAGGFEACLGEAE